MANIDIEVAGRRYSVACRDGEEEHLRAIAAVVDRRARDAASALGNLGESRQLLFTALMLADDIKEVQQGKELPPPPPDTKVAEALEALAARVESLAARAEARTRP